jgi:hypothetical protein
MRKTKFWLEMAVCVATLVTLAIAITDWLLSFL